MTPQRIKNILDKGCTSEKAISLKRNLRSIIIWITVILLAVILAAGASYAYGGKKVVKTDYTTISHSRQITVKWDRKWGVRHYAIYRIDITGEIYTSDEVPFERYDKVGSVSGLHASFVDETVRNGHYYAYVIRGYGKNKLLCDSFKENITQYECAGLAKPDLINAGYGEFNENSPECIFLYVQKDGGMTADGIQLYRKAKGDKEFKRIDPEIQKNETGEDSFETFDIKDTSVKPGTEYTYRVRTFAEEDGKRTESAYSDPLEIAAVNFVGKYAVTMLRTQPGAMADAGSNAVHGAQSDAKSGAESGRSKLEITLKSHDYNGRLKIEKGTTALLTVKDKAGKDVSYDLSLDHETVIDAKEQATLTFTCKAHDLPDLDRLAGSLNIGDEGFGVEYDIGISGWTELRIDLESRAGTVFVDYDN